MNENDLRVVKSRANICSSFMALLKEKPLQAISVKDICDRAMCSRNTFYMHFPAKESVLESLNRQCADAILSGFSEEVDCLGQDGAEVIWRYTVNIIHAAGEARELLTFLIHYEKGSLFGQLTETLYRFFVDVGENFKTGNTSMEYGFYCKYIAAGLVNFLIFWMEHPEIEEKRAQEMLYHIHSKPVEATVQALDH